MVLQNEEQELVLKAQKGEVTAVTTLYERYHLSIFRYVYTRVKPRELAEDLTGEVFYRMVAHLPQYRFSEAPFRAWLYRIAHNLIVDHYRLGQTPENVPLTETLPDTTTTTNQPELWLEETIHAEQIQQALSRLDQAQSDVLSLRFLVGLSLQETADVLQKSVAAVKSLQHRGLTALKGVLYQMEVLL